jgi:signal transduction histidine kinase/DNA-binding NarL/FixJ family response regulator
MAHCPAYQGAICSLCCTLDARCGDLCKPRASLSAQWSAALRWLLPRRAWPYLDTGLGHFLLLMLAMAPLLAVLLEVTQRAGVFKTYMLMLLVAGVLAWWLVLAHKSRQVAQEESNRQTHLLMREIESHRQTDEALQNARLQAERAQQAAEQANHAKSRYIGAISHELRTPLNSILGYAQLMGEDAAIPPHRKHAVNVIRRGGEHLLSLIEGTLDIARIESGKLTLNVKPMRFADWVHETAGLFELQAAAKGLAFRFEAEGELPDVVRADEKRVRQILINLLGNAIKFTAQGQVVFRVRHAREMAQIEIEDSGPGMSAEELAHIFEPFARGTSAQGAPGAGLGLTIAKMLTDLMGGELSAASTPGEGSVFRVRLFLPEVHAASVPEVRPAPVRRGYAGPRRRVLVVDNEEADRDVLVHLLEPLGFELRTAASGHDALDLLAAGLAPHAILMDLAMPGIDGWETIRRIRRMPQVDAAIAVVSANAFDKGLENDAGIRTEDFILKPVRHGELLDWLERQLALQWLAQAPPPALAGPAAETAPAWPSEPLLAPLREAVQLGYYRGILNQLDAIEAAQPECAAFCAGLREQARQFQFEAIARELARGGPVTVGDAK